MAVHEDAVPVLCPVCQGPAVWAIGPDTRACTPDLGQVLAVLYTVEPYPAVPYLPVPLRKAEETT